MAVGVGLPTRVPKVWSLGSRRMTRRGISPASFHWPSTSRNRSARDLVLNVEIVAHELGVEVPLQAGDPGHRGPVAHGVRDELAKAEKAHVLRRRAVPEVSGGGMRDHRADALGGIRKAVVAPVVQGPGALDVVGGVGGHRPLVAVGRDLALNIEVVEQDELARQGVVIGGDRPRGRDRGSGRRCRGACRRRAGRRCGFP